MSGVAKAATGKKRKYIMISFKACALRECTRSTYMSIDVTRWQGTNKNNRRFHDVGSSGRPERNFEIAITARENINIIAMMPSKILAIPVLGFSLNNVDDGGEHLVRSSKRMGVKHMNSKTITLGVTKSHVAYIAVLWKTGSVIGRISWLSDLIHVSSGSMVLGVVER